MDFYISKLLKTENNNEELFMKKINSKLKMDISQNKVFQDEEWIDYVIFSLPYVEKALNKPNKNIITEEEIVKIELIKKVSVESIKHLAKNTNLISEYDEETNDVIPSKILNAYKEETYLTYENRFIYSLIRLLDDFIYVMTKPVDDNADFKTKNYKKANYSATTRVRNERIRLNFEYYSEKVLPQETSTKNIEKIDKIKKDIKMLKMNETYKLLDSKRITLVKSPLKMTNVLLKNVNFQYCVKLWNYLNDHLDIRMKAIKAKKDYEETGYIKKMTDEDFLLKYMIFNLSKEEDRKAGKRVALDKKEQKEVTDMLMERILDINPELTEKELKQMIADKYFVYRNRMHVSLKPLEEAFKASINKYLKQVRQLKLK